MSWLALAAARSARLGRGLGERHGGRIRAERYSNPAAYYGPTPGLDLGAARLLASRCIGNVGADKLAA